MAKISQQKKLNVKRSLPTTWFLIADDRHAQLYMRTVNDVASFDDIKTDLVPLRGMRWDKTMDSEAAMQEFILPIAVQVNVAAHCNAFNRMVIIAPQEFIDALKPRLDEKTLAKIVAELSEGPVYYDEWVLTIELEEMY